MRLSEITVNTAVNQSKELALKIHKECGPALDVFRATIPLNFFYRGNNRGPSNVMLPMTVHTERRPKDMDMRYHYLIDTYLEKRIGFSARSKGLFVFGNEKSVSAYGNSHIVFPIGEFNCFWSPEIQDMYNAIDDLAINNRRAWLADTRDEEEKGSMADAVPTAILEFLDTTKWYVGPDKLGEYFKYHKSNELVLDCPNGYYMLPENPVTGPSFNSVYAELRAL